MLEFCSLGYFYFLLKIPFTFCICADIKWSKLRSTAFGILTSCKGIGARRHVGWRRMLRPSFSHPCATAQQPLSRYMPYVAWRDFRKARHPVAIGILPHAWRIGFDITLVGGECFDLLFLILVLQLSNHSPATCPT